MTDLTRLTARQRQALDMLARGHTAKSIAVELGVTPAAVNEWLREARRKTGAASSRELARRLQADTGAPENRHEKVGVDAGPPPALFSLRNVLIGAFAMTVLAASVGAFVALSLASVASDGPPRVIATSPAAGVVVPAGAVRLSVTFDRQMRPDGYSFTSPNPASFPQCAGKPTVSADGRTFTLACVVQAGRTYEVGFNSERFRNFVAADDGAPAVPTIIRFRTR